MSDLLQLAIYNPAILKDEDFLAGFVARKETADDITRRLRNITPRNTAKHRLILGQRGMGKTSLLRRIALGIRDDEELSKILLPLTFREEQYNVHNLHTFWCNCLDALGDYFERAEQHDKAVELDRQVAGLNRVKRVPSNEDEGGEALAALKAWGKREGKRILLLIDNIDLILEGLTKQHWDLRRTLQEAGGVVVIGAATAYLEATADPKGAFYDFFQVTVLERLSQEELLACLRKLAEARGEKGRKALHILNTDPGRIRTLHDLTGGNLRTLVLLYLLLERDADDEVMHDLERLLDEVTVLYKARVEDLAPQARVVLDAVALNWDPVTAAELGKITGMETSAISSQLDRLIRNGIVEKASVSTSTRIAFQLGERFFNIWYLMRHGPRRQRTRLRWLTGFLRGFYSPQQLTEKAKSLLMRHNRDGQAMGHYCIALGDAIDDKGLRNLLGKEARRDLERLAAQQGKRLDEIVNLQELPEPSSAAEWFNMGWWLHVELGRYEEAEAAYRQAIKLDPRDADPWNNLGDLLQYRLNRHEEAEAAYRHAIKLDPRDVDPWEGLGLLLQYRLNRFEEAEAAYRRAVELDPKSADPWNYLGNLLQYRLNRYEEAEAAYRQAIKLDPKDAGPWDFLGDLLQYHLNRYEEAEAAYRHAIKLDPKDAVPWNDLGGLLQYRLNRYGEAEAAYRHAIKLDPSSPDPWDGLGDLLQYRLNRYEEAEAAYRQAIELDPKYPIPWTSLGNLLLSRSNRSVEAEAAYRRSIELDPKFAFAWNGLGNLLQYQLNRWEEAEAAYHQAIQLDSKYALPWNGLGNLLQYQLNRYEEAEAAYRQAIQLDPDDGLAWNGLGNLLQDHLGRIAEAANAYRKCMEIAADEFMPVSNLTYLLLGNDGGDEAEHYYRLAQSKLPPHGSAILTAYAELTRDNFGAAIESLKEALDSGHPELQWEYFDDILRVLRLATKRNYGEKLLNWLDESGLADRYWPLRAAFDAYLHGEAKLGDVNPEVGNAARRIYQWLTSAPAASAGLSATSPQSKTKGTPRKRKAK